MANFFNQLSALKNRVGGSITSAVQDVQKDDSWMGRAMRFVRDNPTPIDYAKKYFQPTKQLRTRDVIREIPTGILQTAKNIKQGKILSPISEELAKTEYFKPTEKVRARDFIRELPTGIEETAKMVVRDIARFGISLKELPETFRTGKASEKYYNTPLGKLGSFQTEAQLRVKRGDPLWKAIGNPAIETIFAAGDIGTISKVFTGAMKSSGIKALSDIAHDLTTPVKGKEIVKSVKFNIGNKWKSIQEIEDYVMKQNEDMGKIPMFADDIKKEAQRLAKLSEVKIFKKEIPKTGFEYKSGLLKNLQRPGLSIEDVSKKSPLIKEGITPKKGILQVAREEKLAKEVDGITRKINQKVSQMEKTGATGTTPPPKIPSQGLLNTTSSREFYGSSYKNITDALKNTWKTRARAYFVDRMAKVKNLLRTEGVKISDEADPYLAETLFHGRLATRLKNIQREVKMIDKDIINTAKKLKKDIPDISEARLTEKVNKFLIAKHTPERNLALGEKATGITTEESKAIISEIESSKDGMEIKRIAESYRKIDDMILDTLLEGQVITKELYQTLKTKYPSHIPLQRMLGEVDDLKEFLTGGRGFNIKGTGLKRAKGSELEIKDILTNITANLDEAVMRAEKNRVGLSVLNFARENKKVFGDLFEEIKPQAIGETWAKEGIRKPILQEVKDPLVITIRENGKPVYLKINDDALSKALQGINKEQLPGFFKITGAFTRFYSGLATRYNPEFVFSNLIRDMQENMVFMSAQKDIGIKGALKTPTKTPKAMWDIMDYMRGGKSKGANLYKQMIEDGGTTGGMALSTRKNVELDIEAIKKVNRSNPRKAIQGIIKSIDNWNQIFEDSSRLSAYKVALQKGYSRSRAAQIAKEATVNFNRKGIAGPIINSLYMF